MSNVYVCVEFSMQTTCDVGGSVLQDHDVTNGSVVVLSITNECKWNRRCACVMSISPLVHLLSSFP